jgi:hypothetical protein
MVLVGISSPGAIVGSASTLVSGVSDRTAGLIRLLKKLDGGV